MRSYFQPLNFMRQFAARVEIGKKRQTIREVRKVRPIKPGDILRLYEGLRTKDVRLLRTELCLGVTPIKIHIPGGGPRIDLAGTGMVTAEARKLASKDGFDNAAEMLLWFEKQYSLPFEGVLILW